MHMMWLLRDKSGLVAPPHRGSSWKTKFRVMEDCSLRGQRLGRAGQVPLLENYPNALETSKKWKCPQTQVPKYQSRFLQAAVVSTVLGCLVRYVQNYLFGATPLFLKKSLSFDKHSS